jgi:hypothetical protein
MRNMKLNAALIFAAWRFVRSYRDADHDSCGDPDSRWRNCDKCHAITRISLRQKVGFQPRAHTISSNATYAPLFGFWASPKALPVLQGKRMSTTSMPIVDRHQQPGHPVLHMDQ